MNQFTDGFGSVSREQLDDLVKALSAGDYNAAPNTLTNGAALQTESLDASLKSVTFEMKNLKIWPAMPKSKAYNILEEYNRVTSYGESQNGGFFDANAGTAPDEHTAAYNRQVQTVRYIGTTRVVSLPLTMVRPAHGPIIAAQIRNGTMWILQQTERQLYEANGFFESATGTFTGAAADVAAGSIKFNGLEQQIRDGNQNTAAQYTGWEQYGGVTSTVRDLNNTAIDEEDLEELASSIADNHGIPNEFHVDLKTLADMNKQFYPKERTPLGQPNGSAGVVLKNFLSSAGEIAIVSNVFLRPKKNNVTAQTGAPATPVNSASSTEADTSSELGTATYYYRVSAFNNKGESAAAVERSQAITTGNRVTLTIDAGTTGAIYYGVYRSSVAGGPYAFIGYVKDSSAGGAGGATFRDAGHKNPGCATGFMLSMNPDNLTWRQLAPLMKMDLAVTGPALRWQQFLFGTPVVFTPLFNGLAENVGRL